jgi:GDP-D-mannose dehydratase
MFDENGHDHQDDGSRRFVHGLADRNSVPNRKKGDSHPCSPYGTAKLYAHNIIQIYRKEIEENIA